MLLSHLSFIVMCYDICKRCGAPHDDGTEELCMSCLEELCDEAFYESLPFITEQEEKENL